MLSPIGEKDCQPVKPIALTMGEPAGIAAEITAAAWHALHGAGPCFFLIGDADAIQGCPVARISAPEEAAAAFGDALPVLHSKLAEPAVPGRLNPANAPAVIASIEAAVALSLAGRAAAVVTNPIQKSVLTGVGFKHPGHTEFLHALAPEAAAPVMMLVSPELRVVPVTIHEPLARAIGRLTPSMIVEAAEIVQAAQVRDFGIVRPRLAIAGLNPHAGEAGTMGHEDQGIVAPAVATLQAMGVDARGPMPPDTMFTALARPRMDCAICMYHDQGLIPAKTLAFDSGVNTTLGLPFIRTSPDHGTAFDIAGRGIANADSMMEAIEVALQMTAAKGTHV
jgi:4-hydroxythreonine-4-phosphate dehydrogenase